MHYLIKNANIVQIVQSDKAPIQTDKYTNNEENEGKKNIFTPAFLLVFPLCKSYFTLFSITSSLISSLLNIYHCNVYCIIISIMCYINI